MLTAPLEQATIAALVPHTGVMCLLHRALAWDAESIACSAISHCAPDNPLRRDGRLPAICGVEYALQAMALHGALTGGGGGAQPPGYLASLRDLLLGAERLDDVTGELSVTARALARQARGFVYVFAVSAGELVLLSGQAAIILPGAQA